MLYRSLGKSGLKVSCICLGVMSYGDPAWRSWVLPEAESRPFIRRALELGINFFDSANMYSLGRSEEVLGRALKDFAVHDEVVIATKVYFPLKDKPNSGGLSRKSIMDACEASLKRLGSDYIDLYQIHRWDYETPIEETLEALHDLVKRGYVRYLGASSMFAYQFTQALYKADLKGLTRFVSMQNHYNLVYREEEREMLPLCAAEGIGVIPWSPLARGLLARGGKGDTERAQSDTIAQRLYTEEADLNVARTVAEVAAARGVSPAQVALAWLLNRPTVTAPIVGATKMQHLEDAVKALELTLTAEETARLEAAYVPHPVLGHA